MELSQVMPEVTAETMHSQVVDVEKHPYAREILITILRYVKKTSQQKSTTLAVANIRGMTQNRIDRQRHDDPAKMELFFEQYETALDENLKPIYDGNHSAKNPRRWKPSVFLEAIRSLCETELARRGFTCHLLKKTKKQDQWQIEEKRPPTHYWVLELKWA